MRLYLIALLCIQLPLCAIDVDITILSHDDVATLHVVESNIVHGGKNAAISIVSDGTNTYILKQVKNNNFHAQLSLVKEAIVSAIGCMHGISVDKNVFIPYNVGEHLKIYKNQAATLHTYIQGKSLSDALPDFLSTDFRISQVYRPYLYEYNYGFDVEYGLNKVTIKSMACHKDFSGIVALDTFFGNFDRDTDNIIYDEKSDRFYGIDQGATFTGDLPFLPIFAYHQCIKLQMLGFFNTCSFECMQSLDSYTVYLQNLSDAHKPQEIVHLFEKLIPLLSVDEIKNKHSSYIHFLESYIHQSHQLCLNIVDLLSNVVDVYHP